MKNITFILIFFIHSTCFGQWNYDSSNGSCEMAVEVCGTLKNHYVFPDTSYCESPIEPVYFSFNFAEAGTYAVTVFPNNHSGSYVYYGPFTSNDFSVCEQINLGSVQSVSGSFVQLPGFPYGGDDFSLANEPGYYILMLQFDQCDQNIISAGDVGLNFGIQMDPDIHLLCNEVNTCQDCITSFSPTPGKYLVSAWVKEEGASMNTTAYANSSITVSFTGDPYTETLLPSGQIIDGWQRVEGIIEVPLPATDIHLSFETSSGTSYYDDIRFHPLDGSMMSYVYDPISLRLMAELDERNYATLYEYDEEGKLIRVKKETEKGIMTIQENRDNITKQ